MTSLEKVEKLEKALQLFLLPDYNIISTTYLDLLLTRIADDNTKLKQNHRELFLTWISKALNTWNSNSKPCQAVGTFTIKLVGLIAEEEVIRHWYHENVFSKLSDVFHLRENNLPASIKVAYTSMLCNLIQYPSGRKWVNDSNVWRDMISFTHLNHTLYVTRESQKFVWSLLLYESENTDFCKEIISAAVAPLIQNSYNTQAHPTLEENYMSENAILCNTLDLLTSILENTLFHSLDNTIPSLIEELANLETRTRALFEACISTRFLQHILKLLLLTLFKRLKDGIKSPMEQVDAEASEKFRFGLCYISTLLLSKKYVLDIVRMNKFSLIYWKKLNSLCKFTLGLPHKFEHQAICLMLMPLSSTYGTRNTKHDFFEIFINKMFEITCTTIQRLAYNVRDVIMKTELPLEQICKSSIEMLLEIMNIMDRDVAIITFQTMCYVLKNYTHNNEHSSNTCFTSPPVERQKKFSYKTLLDGEPIIEKPILLSSLLDGLIAVTEKFKLKWQECVETICILSLAQHILDHSGVSPTICVKALKLCKLAIQNFMPPNLALLVDSDSNMNEIGPALFKRIHNPNWEVVDSVLEVLNTMATISEDKYPAFQDFLLNHNFLEVAVSIAMSDGESYVRASALIFIATTVRIEKLWSTTLFELELPEKAIYLITHESEAIVRREAVSLLTELYINRQWQKTTIDVMTHAMAVAAVLDLHWEVKVNALQFWRQFIKSHFTDQGMLDGSFPNVTFSKEHRKIVQLNETEIKRRINKALDDLAKQNCLGVLLQTLKDESDFEVCKASAKLMNRLKTFLVKYKINEPFPEIVSPKDSAILDTTYVRPPNIINYTPETTESDSSNVIDEIVRNNDSNLLSAIYENSMKMNDSQTCESEKGTLKSICSVTRSEFLNVILEMDIDAYIEEKNSWLTTYTNSFESVLDDILTLYQQKDVNSMDCY